MKQGVLCLSLVLLSNCQFSTDRQELLRYEPDSRNPYGLPNPDAPAELAQFSFMIGQNDCEEERLNSVSGEWDTAQRTWDAHYMMNGFAIRDSGRSGTATNGNIRMFDPATGQWQVTFFSAPVYGSGVWSGGMDGENMVLKQPQKALGTDLDGFSRLTFSAISDRSFHWAGEWVSEDGSVVFPFWRISCSKVS